MENVDGSAQINEKAMYMYERSAAMRSAWTENNSAGRFLGCTFYGHLDVCDYFKWVDPLVHPCYKRIINGLLTNANHKATLKKKLQIKILYHRILLAMILLVVLVQMVL
ncbi:GRF-type domain-containing protein [Forsythia ovata]|uniref:GRF-type domain-containing protein n=1 Tax=Forsythia ovata TaxID=205694 RepID=A0ABD1WXY7_9LAMI